VCVCVCVYVCAYLRVRLHVRETVCVGESECMFVRE